ncbi:MAG: co-chaperone GroES [Ruminococcus sp.]|nr:co-chaperone GroES [Ruminococcus sp.]
MTIKPLLDKIVLKADDAVETTASGIVLSSAAQEKPQFANVVAVGPGGKIDGEEVTMYVKVGDKVITTQYCGTKVKIDGEEYTIVRQSDILALVE